MTIAVPKVEWRVRVPEAALDFDAELHREQWQLHLSIASLGRDRQGYRGQTIFKVVTNLGSDQIMWVQDHQPFLYYVWKGGLSGFPQPVSDAVVFTADQFLEESTNATSFVKDFDTLFFRSQLVSALIAVEEREGHTKFFGEVKRIYEQKHHSY